MRALIEPQCSRLVGILRAKGYKKPFTATLRGAVCGDGYDPEHSLQSKKRAVSAFGFQARIPKSDIAASGKNDR